jgi:hypothetical protein
MPRKNSTELVRVEVMPPPPARTEADFRRLLAELVDERVAEILSGEDGAVLEPWFQPKPIAAAIKRELTVAQQQKFSRYFEQYSCMICEKKDAGHASSGMCENCYSRIRRRLHAILREHAAPPDQMDATFRDTEKMARQALRTTMNRARGQA